MRATIKLLNSPIKKLVKKTMATVLDQTRPDLDTCAIPDTFWQSNTWILLDINFRNLISVTTPAFIFTKFK